MWPIKSKKIKNKKDALKYIVELFFSPKIFRSNRHIKKTCNVWVSSGTTHVVQGISVPLPEKLRLREQGRGNLNEAGEQAVRECCRKFWHLILEAEQNIISFLPLLN